MLRTLQRNVPPWWKPAMIGLATACALGGCATGSSVEVAQSALDRAGRFEAATAFFDPVLARLRGAPAPRGPAAQARQHYVAVVFHLAGLTASDENALKREGRLGDAFALETLAQWRLGRLAEARASALRARASGQEALRAETRCLLRAFEGIAKLEAGLDAVKERKPYAEVFSVLAGESGAWRLLGGARTEVTREHPLQLPLLETRLGTFQALKAARENDPRAAAEPERAAAWDRLGAEAAIEFRELAAFPAPDPAQHRETVRFWRERCGFE